MRQRLLQYLSIFLLITLSSCNFPTRSQNSDRSVGTETATPLPSSTPSPTPAPRALTVCMGSEPKSLFLYGDGSVAARSVREAIYDGPVDYVDYQAAPVILEKAPSLKDGDVLLAPVQVTPGALIADVYGNVDTLGEGKQYLPSGCKDSSCAATYTGQEPVTMDQLVIRYKMRADLQWSDQTPLTADDSLYSFEVARALYPFARADVVMHTQVYSASNSTDVEWRGIPGYVSSDYTANYFSPLPRHAWSGISATELITAEVSSRSPVGWGPYKIDEWKQGDHISLSKNPTYFRAAEGLPHFDHLVFRFLGSGQEALAALLAGECDYVDETAALDDQRAELLKYKEAGQIGLETEPAAAWEHAYFGIQPVDPNRPALFKKAETRQAIAYCIDRQKMVEAAYPGQSEVLDSYTPLTNPMHNPDVKQYPFDPQTALSLLQTAGWVDDDGNPATPLKAVGVDGAPDGTPFEFSYLIANDPATQRAAQVLQSSLAQCGVKVNLVGMDRAEMLAAGPGGLVFGRNFDMAQFSWIASLEPPCQLYSSNEIPGPYPQFSKGWAGANASGFTDASFDSACQQAAHTLPDSPEHLAAHKQAQAIFAEQLPSIPLYLHFKMIAMRPDLCNVQLNPVAESALWNLEQFDYGDGCPK